MSSRPISVLCMTFLSIVNVSGFSGRACAADVIVGVTGGRPGDGDFACALFSNATGFPLDSSTAVRQRAPARGDGEACRFRGVKPGTYALAVSQLAKGQTNVTLDLLGRPRQAWGVSNGIRPALRAPNFDEAAFTVKTEDVRIDIRIAQ